MDAEAMPSHAFPILLTASERQLAPYLAPYLAPQASAFAADKEAETLFDLADNCRDKADALMEAGQCINVTAISATVISVTAISITAINVTP